MNDGEKRACAICAKLRAWCRSVEIAVNSDDFPIVAIIGLMVFYVLAVHP